MLLFLVFYVMVPVSRALAARIQHDQTTLQQDRLSDSQMQSNSLMTYYYDMFKPSLAPSTRGDVRPGRTGVTVKLTDSTAVSRFMSVVSPARASGMMHSVSNTWETLKVRV